MVRNFVAVMPSASTRVRDESGDPPRPAAGGSVEKQLHSNQSRPLVEQETAESDKLQMRLYRSQ
jgi:hypothetical protein